MKVQKTPKQFEPISLILETQEEIDKFYAILAHSVFSRKLELGDSYILLSDYKTKEHLKWHNQLSNIVRPSEL